MRKIPLLLCLLVAAFVCRAAEANEPNPILDTAWIPSNGTTSELDLTGKPLGYSFKIYDMSGPSNNYGNGWNGYLQINNIPEGMVLHLEGTTQSEWVKWDYLKIWDGATTKATPFKSGCTNNESTDYKYRFGPSSSSDGINYSITDVSVTGTSSAMLLLFHSDGSNNSEGVDLTATIFVKSGDFVFTDNEKTNLFRYIGKDDNVEIPSSVTAICNGAFKGCNIETIDVPSEVQTIGTDAFAGITVVNYTGNADDENDNNWGAVARNGQIVGDFIMDIEDETVVIAYIGSSPVMQIPAGITRIGGYAFDKTEITDIDFSLATNLTEISEYAFSECNKLTSVTIPASVTDIYEGAFFHCENLWTVDFSLAESLESIEGLAFSECDIISVTVPSTVSEIGVDAFEGVTNINYPEDGDAEDDGNHWGATYRNMQDGNFIYGDADHEVLIGCAQRYGVVEIPDGVTTIGSNAFIGCNVSVYVPQSVTDIASDAFSGVINIVMDEENTLDPEENDNWGAKYAGYDVDANEEYVYYYNEGNILLGYIGEASDDTIPNTFVGVYNGAFSNCFNLQTVTIPVSIEFMDEYIFANCPNLIQINCEAGMEMADESWNSDWNVYGDGDRYPVKWLCNKWDFEDGVLTLKDDVNYSYDDYGEDGYYYYPWYDSRNQIDSVVVEKDVTVIGYAAFYEANFTSIDFTNAKNLKTIDYYAFEDCDLNSVAIPASVENIKEGAFCYNYSLETVDFSNDTNLINIGSYAFYECYELTSVNLNEATKLETIGHQAFYETNLKNVDIPVTVSSIGNNAFAGTKNINYPADGEAEDEEENNWGALARNGFVDGDFVFSDETETELLGYIGAGGNVTIPLSVESIGYSAFNNSKGLTSVVISASVEIIDDYAFANCEDLESVDFSQATKMTEIGSSAFYNCEVLTSIDLSQTQLSTISDYMLEECAALESALLPSTVEKIEADAFEDCKSLKNIVLPETLTVIEEYAFSNCDSLKSIIIPESVEYIGKKAFRACDSLKTVSIPSSIKYINSYAFEDCPNLEYNIDEEGGFKYLGNSENPYVVLVGRIDEEDTDLSDNTVKEGVQYVMYNAFDDFTTWPEAEDGAYYLPSEENTHFMLVKAENDEIEECVINEDTKFIHYHAFKDCDDIEEIIIPEAVEKIGKDAFINCDDDLTIFCEAEEQPEGWNEDWNAGEYTTIWHYNNLHVDFAITGRGSVIVSIVDEEAEVPTITDLRDFAYGTKIILTAKPGDEDFFVQWGNGANEYFDSTLVVVKDTTCEVEFHKIQEVKVGENIVYATYVQNYDDYFGGVKSVLEDDEEEGLEFNINCVFTPEVSGNYTFYSESDKDTYCMLFNSNMRHLTHDDAGAGDEANNFKFSYPLEAGETYYIAAGFYYTNIVENIKLYIKAPVTVAVRADEECGSVSVSYSEGGQTIFGEDGEVTVTYGKEVTVSATANENYEFLRWSDGSTDSDHTFDATEDVTLEAIFYSDDDEVYYITAEVKEDQNEMGTVTGSSYYLATEDVTLEAIPAAHHHFVEWSNVNGEVLSTENQFTFTPDRDSTIYAAFAIDTVKLTVLAENGTPSLDEPTVYEWGTVVSISAEAAAHYHFVEWSDGVTDESREIEILSDTTVTAIYVIDSCVVEITEAKRGTVTGAEDGEYEYGKELTLTATAVDHYHFVKWSNGETENPYTFALEKDTILSAEFAIDTFSVTLAETVENGTVKGIGKYTYGREVSFEATPDEGYKFARWNDWTASDNKENPLRIAVVEDVVLSPLFIDENKDLVLVTVNATEGGTVTPTGTIECLTGDKVTLTASAAEGYLFARWSDDLNNKQTSREITITSDTTITAQFRPRTIEIEVIAGAHGKVTGGEFYAYNSKATITAIPDKGYHFVKWKETGSTEAEFSITVKEEQTFTAEFAIDNYAIAATAVANGTVAGAGNYDYGTEVTLTATPAAGYHFVKWSNDATANPYKFAAESNLTLTAEFAINTYEVTVSAANGTVTGAGTYNHGAEATLTATAAEGYSFVKWSDGVTEASRKVTVTSNLAFTAEFAINSYDVTATATNGVVEGTGKYNYGAEATLNAVANKGYHFVKWSDDVTTATRKETVKGNLSFTAVFAANTYTVTVNAEANGTVSGAGTYEYGATATLEATANDGYRFDKWSDGEKTAKRTIEVVGDTTLTASFAVRTYEITAEAQNGKVEGVGTYNRGDEVELTAKPNVGYHFVCWSDSVIENPRKVIVNNDTTVTALFEKEAITISVNGKFGKITGSTGKLEFGATVTLTAVPDSGYHFVMWSDSVLDNPRTVTLTAELLMQVQESGFEFSAIFEKDDEPGVAVADEAAEAVKIFAFGNTIAVENADSDIFVFNAMGRLISRTAPEAGRTEIKVNGTGIYVVKTGNAAKRVMIND
ncbi:MAG: leucine-rich repeat protein [Salinivirgaceae bacterium]|nr:leucine-rich repeat protein [Salinivirgaceae bacterium]